MKLFGGQHQALVDWLVTDWWTKGPPVAVIHGFPGIGKTEVALRAIDSLGTTHSSVPMTRFICPETRTGSADDLLLTIAEELAAVGDPELIERLERGEDTISIFSRMLVPPRLIVVDEAQRLLVGSTGAVSTATASFLERWSSTSAARGRLLLVSNREFDFARWNERVEATKLYPLKPNESENFLVAELEKNGRVDTVPRQRFSDIVTWLGCNPRAIRLLVSALAREKLEDLIGLAPEAWEVRDRAVSPQLLREFERVVLERAEERLDSETQLFVRRLSVLRRPVDRRALQALSPSGADVGRLRDELLARFMMEFRSNHYDMHPVLRDAIRFRLTGPERRRAHLATGRYYAAAFRARRIVGEAEKLGARFIEARYHFTMAESEGELAEISHRFEAHFRAQFQSGTPIPADPEERDERIALLSALLQTRGAKGLEEYLARCLVVRNQPGDVERALPHARRATGPQASIAAWILRIRLENELFGATQAAKVASEAISIFRQESNLGDIFFVTAQALAGSGKSNEAVELLHRGIKEVPIGHSRSVLQRALGKLLAGEGNTAQGLAVLHQAIKEVPPGQNRSELQLAAAKLLVEAGKIDEAVELLHQASLNAPRGDHSRSFLQLAAGQILSTAGKSKESIAALRQAIKESPPGQPRTDLELAAAEILEKSGRTDHAVELLREGLKVASTGNTRSFLQHAVDRILGATIKPLIETDVPHLNKAASVNLDHEPQLADGQDAIFEASQHNRTVSVSLFDSERIIRAMRPDNWFGLYVLGCYDDIKTVYVQQCRALTLVHALFETGELGSGRRLGVIGGGAAGITAAAAAATKGANVILFERSDTLMTLQSSSMKRYLHPHLYHWPASASIELNAKLPILNWHAGRSYEVAKTITTAFDEIRQSTGRIDVRLGKSIQDIGPVPSNEEARRVQIIGAEGEINELVDVAIIAIGFGVEHKRSLGVDTPAYWEDDGLDQNLGGAPDQPLRVLISGAGDGALTDILRATLRTFWQGEIMNFLPRGDALTSLQEKLQAIEKMAARAALKSSFDFVNLHKKYGELDLDQSMVDEIKNQIRKDTEVWFNYTSPGRYTLNSSLLNRFLVSVLCRFGAVKPKLARLNEKSIAVNTAGKFIVTWPNSEETLLFDKVIIRHGPPKDHLGSVFPKLDDACAPLRGKLRELDLTGSLHEATRQYFST